MNQVIQGLVGIVDGRAIPAFQVGVETQVYPGTAEIAELAVSQASQELVVTQVL